MVINVVIDIDTILVQITVLLASLIINIDVLNFYCNC